MVDTTPQPNVQKLLALFGGEKESGEESCGRVQSAISAPSVQPTDDPSPVLTAAASNGTHPSTTLQATLTKANIVAPVSSLHSTLNNGSVTASALHPASSPSSARSNGVSSSTPAVPLTLEGFKPVLPTGDIKALSLLEKPAVKPKPTSFLYQKNFLEDLTSKLERSPGSSQTSSLRGSCRQSDKKPSRRPLPALEILGPPPEKPPRPDHLTSSFSDSLVRHAKGFFKLSEQSSACNLQEEEEDLYEDALQLRDLQDYDQELYNDVTVPPVPLSARNSVEDEEEALYNDVLNHDDQIYEVPTPTKMDPLLVKKSQKEEEKRLRREMKEQEKFIKEQEKIKKKFGLYGEVVPVDARLVKSDSRGGRSDLAVYKGETVLILRMEGNPTGKWLAKNGKGKVGYVDVTNIEVDPDSVKTVMTTRRDSRLFENATYYEPQEEEEEAIYESPR